MFIAICNSNAQLDFLVWANQWEALNFGEVDFEGNAVARGECGGDNKRVHNSIGNLWVVEEDETTVRGFTAGRIA